MSIITLTTDWGNDGYYISAVKGLIYGKNPETRIIDISHSLPLFSVVQAAFILRNTFRNFPEGTIHIIGINSENTKTHPHIILKYEGHFFIGSDNGIFGLLLESSPELIVALEEKETTFPELDVFTQAAIFLINGRKPEELGEIKDDYYRLYDILPTIGNNLINGKVIHIDSFGNAITNISKELFEEVGTGKKFDIFMQSNAYKLNKISKKYVETPEGEFLAVFNSCNLLELAINKGKIAELIKLSTNSVIRIKFYDSTSN
ncbi:MAG: SAM-dependent chlorinase/fluorinase [Bacteroidales bacterium]|nr:SAM-dependent chlorinase/fluorinase [Bacteroidales bacterium]